MFVPSQPVGQRVASVEIVGRATMPEQDHENADRAATCSTSVSGPTPRTNTRRTTSSRTSKGATSTGSRRGTANTPGRP